MPHVFAGRNNIHINIYIIIQGGAGIEKKKYRMSILEEIRPGNRTGPATSE